MIFDGKIPKSLFRDFQSVEKTYITFKNGVWGVAPSGVRAAAPHSAPFRGERGLGIGIKNKHFFEKTYFFYNLKSRKRYFGIFSLYFE